MGKVTNIDYVIYELHHEKTTFLHVRKQRSRSAVHHHVTDQHLCLRYVDSTKTLLPISEISSLLPSFVAVQPGLYGPSRKYLKTGFLTTLLMNVNLNLIPGKSTWGVELNFFEGVPPMKLFFFLGHHH